jgi:hypothetical protein
MGTIGPDVLDAIPPQSSRLYKRFGWLRVGLAVLMGIMFFVWASTVSFGLGVEDQTMSPWAPVARVEWVAIWGLFSFSGLCMAGFGLVLSARPAWFAHHAGGAVMAQRADWRRWPRLSGLTIAWFGSGLVGLALTIFPSWGSAREPPPFQMESLVIICAVTVMPVLVVTLAARFVPPRPR